jgi:hypothetical protein
MERRGLSVWSGKKAISKYFGIDLADDAESDSPEIPAN